MATTKKSKDTTIYFGFDICDGCIDNFDTFTNLKEVYNEYAIAIKVPQNKANTEAKLVATVTV